MTEPAQWEQLRRPFEAGEINKLPKGKGEGDYISCNVCGARHKARGIFHVDYIGHARVTQRLNEIDPGWEMKPGAMQFPDEDLVFLPVSLTVLGVTHHEVGTASQGDDEWPKQLYSDALTRAAMRFGVGLDLWIKIPPAQEGSQRRTGWQPSQTASGPTEMRLPRGAVRTVDPNKAALLEVLEGDVKHLDQAGMIAWFDWKATHPQWWTSVDVLIEARDFVMDQLAAGETEPWATPTLTRDPEVEGEAEQAQRERAADELDETGSS